ncbi:sperm-associated antigen 8 isoform X4 [Phascolarctos cinereus]
MPEKTEGCEVAEAVEGKGPSLTTSAAQGTAPAEAPAFTAEEPTVSSQRSSRTARQGPEGSADSSFALEPARVCCGFLAQPRLPPMHCCFWEPNAQRSWEALQVPEPGAPGLPWSPESRAPRELLPRGQCFIHNWVEERATNELDRVLNHEESEGFRYRYGHLGLLTLELSSPPASRTTQKDSYQHPGNPRRALRGKREAMLELLLHHQIRKLDRPGPPPPTKPHNLQEQPETYWLQRASKLPGVSNIQTYDTPFRKNCSFSTPVPLSMDQPLPYSPENYPQL